MGSTARASANTSTRAARARFSARAQASAVAPVVITSSITTTFLPLIRPARALSTLNAPAAAPLVGAEADLAYRSLHPPQHEAIDLDAGEPNACASMADWLKRRHHSRAG